MAEGRRMTAAELVDKLMADEHADVVGHLVGGVVAPSSPATSPRRLWLVKPATAWMRRRGRRPGPWRVGSPKRRAPVRWPSWMEGWWMRSKSAEPMAQPWPARSMISRRALTARALATARQVLEAAQAAEVGWLVDDGLDAQRSPFLQVLLDAGVLVAEVDVDLGAGGEDPGARTVPLVLRRTWRPKMSRDLVGAADADVVGDERFEEAAGPAGVVEHQRAGRPRPGASTAPTSSRRPGRRR